MLTNADEFMGYERPKKKVGIRNRIAIIASVSCVNHTVKKIARGIENSVSITHPLGCGQFGVDLLNVQRTLIGLGTNPNVYGVIVVGLGCENLTSEYLARHIKRSKKPVEYFDLQEIKGGEPVAVEKGIKIGRKMLSEAKEMKREPFDFSYLTLGLECGGSDSISGITSNPVVGKITDKIIALGGTAILPEFTEWIGTEHLLMKRAKNKNVAKQIEVPIKKLLKNTMKMGIDFRGTQPSPGNIEGGLTTIEEKSLGTTIKSGTVPIEGVINYSQAPKRKGLWLMIEPGNDIESMTGLAAAGAQIITMTTGRGSPTGNPIAPVIKLCGSPRACEWLKCHIDVDASTIITKQASIEDIARVLWQEIIMTCNGKLTKAEQLSHNNIAIWRHLAFPFPLT
ncbi:MAG: UxaA family hydrolase [Promethearchaeota archaeon]